MTQIISEWVIKGQTVENWDELLTAYISYQHVDVRDFVKVMQDQLANGSKDFQTQILADDTTGITFEWSHHGSGQYPAQREIKKVMKGTDGTYTLSYAVKESSYSASLYGQWKQNILKARLISPKSDDHED